MALKYPTQSLGSVPPFPALMFTWRNNGNCELDNMVLYYRYADYDDREAVPDAALRRDGDYQTLGLENTWYQPSETLDLCAVRRGPFLGFRHSQFWSVSAGVEYERRDTDGTEFDTRIGRLYLTGYLPLKRKGKPEWSLDGYLEYSRADYTKPSIFEPGERRDDDYSYVEFAARRALKGNWTGKFAALDHLNLRFGIGQTWQ